MKALIRKVFNAIMEKFYNRFPLYIYSDKLESYVYSVLDKQDEEIGNYTDVIVTSNSKTALNVRKMSRAERKWLLEKVNLVMTLGGFEFEISRGKQ